MNILGIETSCDETSASVVQDGHIVLSNVISSQIALHRPYCGVVPEIASRSHVEALPSVISDAVEKAGVQWGDIDAVAVTYGPGLSSSLLTGLSSAKALSLMLKKPLLPVNHLEAHMYASFLGKDEGLINDKTPFVALIVSGGHTCLVLVRGIGDYEILGQTIDDAAGEAFDKGANLLGLGYPGGPEIDLIAKTGNAEFVKFPRGRAKKERGLINGMDSDLCFSFSGLKTALRYYMHKPGAEPENSVASSDIPSIAASYQEAIVDALIQRVEKAIRGYTCLVVGGGVSLNSRLRFRLAELARSSNIDLMLAESQFCADNAAMIAGIAGAGGCLLDGDVMNIDAVPNLSIASSLHS